MHTLGIYASENERLLSVQMYRKRARTTVSVGSPVLCHRAVLLTLTCHASGPLPHAVSTNLLRTYARSTPREPTLCSDRAPAS